MRSPRFLQYVLSAACMFSVCNAHSFTWQDLWVSPDKQAEALMKEGQFAKAGELFQQIPWKAAASYRAKNYKQAAQQFGALQSESGYYNQGNALAQMGQYQDALKAYDKALALNPSNQDAIYNRKLVEELLKKNQDKQQNQSDNKQQDNKNNQNRQDKSSGQSSQDKKNQQNNSNNQDNNQQNDKNQGKPQEKQQQDNKQESGQDNKEESGKDSKDKQDKEQQNKEQQNKEQQNKEQQNKEQQDKNSKAGEKPVPAKNDKAEKGDKEQASAAQTQEEREKQQAKEQWLKLIPDDPGGLMREKFLRDYIRRQRGWQQ